MPLRNEKTNSVKIYSFIDFIPAELRVNKDWLVIYYYKNPVTQKLQRFRICVPSHSIYSERIKLGKRIANAVNDKLNNGWSPFNNIEEVIRHKTFENATLEFRSYLKKQFEDGCLRADSVRTYNSNLNLLQQYIIEQKIEITFALQINKQLCMQYLDWIYLDRKSSARTRNNHLIFLRLFCNYLLQRGILAENPTTGIKNLKKTAKKRINIPADVRLKIKNELLTWDNGYYCLCMTIYYCMIRNTELRKLKVENINFNNNTILIPDSISKNNKTESVTIPSPLMEILLKHCKDSKETDYLFSSKDFMPGSKQMAIRKIQYAWEKLRYKLEFKKEYQFYSLKDTGITDLFLCGIPSLKIRNQARHSSVEITELYTPKNTESDETIRNSNLFF